MLRHFQEGSARRAAGAAAVPILNAGDGPGQHPSQALLDVYSIRKEIGRLDNFKIGMVGDLLNGRTVRSLAYLLSMYPGVEVVFVAPPVCQMKQDIKDFLSSKGVAWTEATSLRDVAADVDVLYMTRIQKERFKDPADYAAAKGKYVLDADVMRAMRRDAVVLHPLPRVDEVRCFVCVCVCLFVHFLCVLCTRAGALPKTRTHTADNKPPPKHNTPQLTTTDTNTKKTDRDRGGRRPARRLLPPGAQRPARAHGAAQALPARPVRLFRLD